MSCATIGVRDHDMKRFLFLALTACTTSEHAQLHDLEQHAKFCGSVGSYCAKTEDVTGIVACMNDAEASGPLAEVIWSDEDSYLDYYIFTDGDHLRVLTEDFASSRDSEVHSDQTCTGPLQTTTTAACGEYLQLQIVGC